MKKLSILFCALVCFTPTFAHAEPHSLGDTAGALGVGCAMVGVPAGLLTAVVEENLKDAAKGAGIGCAVGMAVAGYGEYNHAQEAPSEVQLQESAADTEE